MSQSRFRITYLLTCSAGEDPAAKARAIAFEQTVELPESCVSVELRERIVGRVESVDSVGRTRWRAVVSYPTAAVGPDLPQALNLLFGNISLQQGISVKQVEWPADWLERFTGPRFGIAGIRGLCGSTGGRPLLCAALKPVGLSPAGLARICAAFAGAGVDIVKDDHGLADQSAAPFRLRLEMCREAVSRVNARRGGSTLYVPNVTAPADELEQRVDLARRAGCRMVLLSPLLVGPDMARRVAAESGLAVLSHPALCGAFFGRDHGIAPELLLGDLFRIMGSDGVIYPNVGGRFPFDEGTCMAINAGLRDPLGLLRPAFPVPGGGIDAGKVPHWIERYGPDTIFLIGGSLYARSDLARATEALVAAVRTAVE
jgi:ribulose-bisphosphate carboxylase large chain